MNGWHGGYRGPLQLFTRMCQYMVMKRFVLIERRLEQDFRYFKFEH